MTDRRALAKSLLMDDVPDYGYGPMTEATRAGAPNPEMRQWAPTPGEDEAYRWRQQYGRAGERAAPVVQGVIDRGSPEGRVGLGHVAAGLLEHPMATGAAIGDAIDDPSVANVTNATMRSALSVPTFGAAKVGLGALAAGYGAAGAGDVLRSGALAPSEAEAAGKGKKKPAGPSVARLPGLTDEDQSTYAGIMARLSSGDYETAAERRALEDQAKIYTAKAGTAGTKAAELEAAKQAADQAEYERGVTRAEAMASQARSRDDRFGDSSLKKVYDKTGGPIPLAAAAAGLTGAIHRGAPAFQKWLEGTGAAFTVNNAPIGYDAIMAPVVNPEYEAVAVMARELPDKHPDKERYIDLEKRMREGGQIDNPVRIQAWKDFTDPILLAKRLGMSGVEGISALIGGATPRAVGDLVEGVSTLPGRVAKGWNRGMGEAAEAKAAADAANAKKILARRLLEKAQGQTGHQTGSAPVPAEAAPAPAATSQPPAGSSPVAPASTSPVPANQLPNGAPAAGGGQATIGLDPELRQAIIDALSKTGATKQKALPPPGTGPGRWISEVQPTARDVLREHLAGGGTIAKGSGNKLTDEINARLPVSAKEISPAEVRKRVSNMRDAYGDRPDMARLEADVPMGSDVLKGKRVFGIAAPLAAIGASGEDPRELARNILMGR